MKVLLMDPTTKPTRKDESPPDDSDSYAYMKTLLKDESPPNSSNSLFRVLTLTGKPTRRLLKDKSPLDDSDSLYRILTLTTNCYNLQESQTNN